MSKKCMIKKCVRPAAKRGVCLACYSKAKHLVESGTRTWEDLEQLGLVEPEDDPFTEALEKAEGK